MTMQADASADQQRFGRIDAAFRAGDLAALRAAVEDPRSVPNGAMPAAIGACLEYAIYHSPPAFIRTLLEIGAEPNPEHHGGFPPLIAALSCPRARPGAAGRPAAVAVVEMLLSYGADPDQRGINDYTPLHMAVAERSRAAVELLLAAGADPRLRTRIDDCETPREMAAAAALGDIAGLLAAAETRRAASAAGADSLA